MSINLAVASFAIESIFSPLMFILRCRSTYSMRDFTKLTSGDELIARLYGRATISSQRASSAMLIQKSLCGAYSDLINYA